MIGIYKITNIINGKSYIGQSINIDKRIKEHFWKSTCEKDVSYNSILHIALRKYGVDNFKTEILEECNAEELDNLEKYYIEKYNTISPNGYNILSGGQANRAIPNFCPDCGVQILKESKYCPSCSAKRHQKVIDRPSALEIAKMVAENGFSKTGKIFGVSDNTIKKWCKLYNVPHLKSELIKWYNEQLNSTKSL